MVAFLDGFLGGVKNLELFNFFNLMLVSLGFSVLSLRQSAAVLALTVIIFPILAVYGVLLGLSHYYFLNQNLLYHLNIYTGITFTILVVLLNWESVSRKNQIKMLLLCLALSIVFFWSTPDLILWKVATLRALCTNFGFAKLLFVAGFTLPAVVICVFCIRLGFSLKANIGRLHFWLVSKL